jgi:hypothetical protein
LIRIRKGVEVLEQFPGPLGHDSESHLRLRRSTDFEWR